MSNQSIGHRKVGFTTQVARLLHRYGIEEGFRRIVERGAALEAANKKLEMEIAESKRVERELRTQALTDELTGLYNLRGFLSLAEQQMKLTQRMHLGISIVYVDVDGLKSINDVFGHKEGSEAIRETAETLKATFRDSDIIARIGGDEFLVLVMQTTENDSDVIARRLEEELDARNADACRPYKLRCSVGISFNDPGRPRPLDRLISEADKLMYRHKASRSPAYVRSNNVTSNRRKLRAS